MLGIQLDEKVRLRTTREKGHSYIDLLIVCEGSTDEDFVSFMYDTGAWLTVLSRKYYETYKLNALKRMPFSMGGYGAGEDASRKIPGFMYQIPALKIGNRLLTEVWAFTPASYEISENILGCNVIEYFNPYQDNSNDYIYFFDNLTPRPYVHEISGFSLKCGGSFSFEDFRGV
jgi:hypothetical protein